MIWRIFYVQAFPRIHAHAESLSDFLPIIGSRIQYNANYFLNHARTNQRICFIFVRIYSPLIKNILLTCFCRLRQLRIFLIYWEPKLHISSVLFRKNSSIYSKFCISGLQPRKSARLDEPADVFSWFFSVIFLTKL